MVPSLKYHGNKNEVTNFRLLNNDEISIPFSKEIQIKDDSAIPIKRKCCSICFNIWHALIALCKRNLAVFIFIISCIIIVIILILLTIAPTCILGPTYMKPITTTKNTIPFDVILYGDSLITGNHYQEFHLFPIMAAKISSFLPNYNLNVLNFGRGGDGIEAMRGRLQSVIDTPADAVVLLWDSDVSSQDETPQNINYLRDIYTTNVTFVINELKMKKPNIFIALAGPIILGEGEQYGFLDDYHQKVKMLNDYRNINKKIAVEYNISYLDIRKNYLEFLPSYRLFYKYCLTVDGEHENENGLGIIAKNIANILFEWIPKL